MPKTRKIPVKKGAKKEKIEKKAEKHKVDLKKIKIPLEEKNLEGEILETEEEISDIEFREFLQMRRVKAPVLERVAVAQNPELEQQLANVAIRGRGNEEETGIKYGETKADYGTTTPERKRDTFHYTESSDYSITLQKNKESKEARKIMGQASRKGEWGEREERWQKEGETFVEESEETKKYMLEGNEKKYR